MEFPQEIESDSDTEVILGPPKHQTKIDNPERNWEETPPGTKGDTSLPGIHPQIAPSSSINPPGIHSPRLAVKFPHPDHRAYTPHTPDTHLPIYHLPQRPDSPDLGTNSPTRSPSSPPHSPDYTRTSAKMSSDEESPDPIKAFMKKFTDTLEDLGTNKHINVPQF